MKNENIAITLLFIMIFVSIIVIGILIYYCYSGGSDSTETNNSVNTGSIATNINNDLALIRTNSQNRRAQAKTNTQSFNIKFPLVFGNQSTKKINNSFRNPSNYNLPNGLQFSALEPPIVGNKGVKVNHPIVTSNTDCGCSSTSNIDEVDGILNVQFPTQISSTIENGKVIIFSGISPANITLPTGIASGLILHVWNNSKISQTLKANVDIMDNNIGSKTIDLLPEQFITLVFTGSVWNISYKNEDNSLNELISDTITQHGSNIKRSSTLTVQNNNSTYSEQALQSLLDSENTSAGSHIGDIEAELKALLNKKF